jgi:hypothetical protein
MGEVTREELAAMTDQELLAYEREHHGDPYMNLLRAKGMQRVALQFWHLGAARTKADREARRRLLQKLFPSDSAVALSPTAELDVAVDLTIISRFIQRRTGVPNYASTLRLSALRPLEISAVTDQQPTETPHSGINLKGRSILSLRRLELAHAVRDRRA